MSRPVAWVLVHDLERTGVPVALARLAAWQAARPGGPALELHVVAERPGPVGAALAAVASVTTLEPPVGRSGAATAAVALAQAGAAGPGSAIRRRAWRHRARQLPHPDVVLVQGAGAWAVWDALEPAVPATARVVVHLHELATALARCLPAAAVAPFLARADRVLAVCEPVAELAGRAGVGRDRLAIVAGSVDVFPLPRRPAAAPVVLGIGTPGWRKGTDRFVAVAHELRRTHPEASCRWVGGAPGGAEAWAVGADLAVGWGPNVADPWSVLPEAAVLLVPSREDPLPLVVLEAGARGVPVVAAATGGLPALLADGRGLVVPGHDLVALAEATARSLGGPDAADRAAALRRHVAEHHDTAVVGPRWLDALLDR